MVNYRPIITTIGLQVIADAIANGTDIILDTIALGDAANDLEYNVDPSMTALNNEVTRIKVRSISMDIHLFYGEAVARMFGYVAPNSAVDMTVREAGVYDTLGNLIFVTRTTDISTKAAGALRSGVKIKINKRVEEAARLLFKVNAVDNDDAILTEELDQHIEQTLNIHRTTKDQIGLSNVLDISDEDLPISQLMLDMINDSKMATGFVSRTTNSLHSANDMLTLIINSPTGVYKKGVLYTLTENATINLGYQPEWEEVDGGGNPTGVIHPAIPASSGEFFICLDVDTNTLYKELDPDIENDIIVAYVVCNVAQGIISVNDERHTASKNIAWYKTQDLRNKISWLSGGELILATDVDTNVNMGIVDPVLMANKDIHYTITHSDTPDGDYEQDLTNMLPPVMYINNDSEIVVENGVGIPWLNNGSWITYNNRASGVLVEVPDGKYINYLIVYTADVVAPIKMIVGDTVYDTELAASSADVSVFDYILERIRCKVAFKIVLHTDIAYINNIGKVVVSKIENLADNTSLRNSMAPKNHSELGDTRFEDDQHEVDNIEGLRAAVDQVGQIKSARVIGNITGDGVLTDNTVVVDNRQADTSLWEESDKSVVFTSTFGAIPVNSEYFSGIVLGQNGKLYAIPSASSNVLEIDPITKTMAYIGTNYGGTWGKWAGAALAPNGKIYCMPYYIQTQVLEIDPATKTTVLIPTSDAGVQDRWSGAVLAPNGKIYGIPSNATRVLEIDPDTRTTTLIGDSYSGVAKWSMGVLAPNGKIYCSPSNATQVLEIDPASKTTALVGPALSTYLGHGVLAPNGNIYHIGLEQILEFNIDTLTATVIGSIPAGEWFLGILAPNGRIYYPPRNSGTTKILEFNPTTKDISTVGNLATSVISNWSGGVLAPNGKIYYMPYRHTQILEIDTFPKTTDYGSYLFSGQLKI